MLDCMYRDALENIHSNPAYAQMFRARPLRFRLDLNSNQARSSLSRRFSWNANQMKKNADKFSAHSETNADKLSKDKEKRFATTISTAGKISKHKTPPKVEPSLICEVGCETPRLNEKYQGRKYKYFYAISSDIDRDNPGTLIKVNVENNTCKSWSQRGVYPSEPVFVSSPNARVR
uniref:Carotenoid isomerooxygenase n=1 Tax=Cacopsylla melanoneura TaxID=428564 RepID=A0A8D9AQK6_9HEMI